MFAGWCRSVKPRARFARPETTCRPSRRSTSHPPMGHDVAVINRTKALVLGYSVTAWISLLIILEVAPDIYDQTLE